MQLPIIRMSVESMKYSIAKALTEVQAEMDEYLRAAVDEYCTPENLARVVKQQAREELDKVIREEVNNFFRYGEGRQAVIEAVRESILSKQTYSSLDK